MEGNNPGISQQNLVSTMTEKTPRQLPQYIAALTAALGGLAAGLVMGWSSPAGDNGANLDYPFEIDPNAFSWVSSIFNVGAAMACLPIGFLADRLGRRGVMLVVTLPFIVGWACVIWPNSCATLIIGRCLLGLSGGAFFVMVPIYTAEISDSQTRGRLGSYMELFLTLGLLSTYAMGTLRSMFALSLISSAVPIVFFAIFFFMPETPTYNLMRGNVDAARDTLIWLRGSRYNVEPELQEKRDALAESERNKVSFLDAIRSRAAVKGIIISHGLMSYQQLCGNAAIMYYGGTIFANATGTRSAWHTIVVGAAQVVTVSLSTIVIDKWGRRVILLMSATVMCLANLVLGIYFYLKINSIYESTWLPILCVCVFVVSMEFGFGPIPGMMTGEIFSPRIRGIAASSANFVDWTMAFVVTKFYNDATVAVGSHGVYWIFSAISASAIVFVVFLVPETKGKSLEQIQIELRGVSGMDEEKEIGK